MFEAKDILTLLGIPGTKIQSFDTVEDGDEATIYVELEDIRAAALNVVLPLLRLKITIRFKINDSIIKHRKLTVEIRVRRYR